MRLLDMSNEEHGQEFLQYVAENQDRLKKNLRKNITYNEDYFDDVFQTTILKVYDSIMRGLRIENFEKYFFMASKFGYINEDNKQKKRKKNDDSDILWRISHGYETNGKSMTTDGQRLMDDLAIDDDEWRLKEDRNLRINELFKYLSKRLNEVFTPAETDIFLIYYRLKSEKAGVSYRKMAIITEKPISEITQIITKIKKYVKENKDIQEYKNNLLK